MIALIYVAAVLVVMVLVFVLTRPERFRIERSAQVNAPAQVLFPMISDFHQWARWSPYEKLDPNMKKTFGGIPGQPGSSYAWEWKLESREGCITLVESKPVERVTIKLEFTKPFKATNQGNFTFVPTGNLTQVTWSMEGKNSFMGKLMSPFMDGLVGKEFERGLANLNTAAQEEKRSSKGA